MSDIFPNCWEAKNCGREPGGEKITLYGVCPIATATSLDGTHGGKNGGRCCWEIIPLVAELYDKSLVCSGGLHECYKCDFYHSVRRTTKVAVIA
ncbi:MAG: two-CW domain-containing protein [Candidatus Electrothrix aestuarii]|uniref:Two-CW domain-containing protein n=1 Tax=Candidatus Electrothrix aestuarii TaxID=3062594 RepID=A0AAU8LUW7_9BACT|nr:hypothetical protein [Candidatus Electrothrix aestuarii]